MTPQDFKTWRKASKLTQTGAAAAFGLSLATVKLYESGRRYGAGDDAGRPVEIPRTVQLACAALAHGLTPADALRR